MQNRTVIAFCIFLVFAACGSKKNTIRIKGSDTEVNLAVDLAESFYRSSPEFNVSVSGGGSGLGIASLMNGQADIANSSRPLTADEMALFARKNIVLKTVIFAEDATAFVVNKTFPLDSIDVESLRKILNGTYKIWYPVTGKKTAVTIYGRQSNSGTHSFIQNKLGIQFSPEAKEMNGSAQIMEGVKMDPSGIGYVGAGYITGSAGTEVKVLKIKASATAPAISPLNGQAIKAHLYFFQRPLYQFVPTTSWERALPFILFEKGPQGRTLIKQSGYYVTE